MELGKNRRKRKYTLACHTKQPTLHFHITGSRGSKWVRGHYLKHNTFSVQNHCTATNKATKCWSHYKHCCVFILVVAHIMHSNMDTCVPINNIQEKHFKIQCQTYFLGLLAQPYKRSCPQTSKIKLSETVKFPAFLPPIGMYIQIQF